MSYDYNLIKKLAKQQGKRVLDFLALSPQNDPFYVGTRTDIAQAQWFKQVWDKAGYVSGVHLRRVHYWLVSQGDYTDHLGKPYENTEKAWDYLGQASKMARYLGYVNIADIADHKSPDPTINAHYMGDDRLSVEISTPSLERPYLYINGLDNTAAQPYHLEIWCEKSTMNDVLLPICQRYGGNLATFQGEVSITACYALTQRIKASGGKPTRIFYISDFDPAGNSMPVAMSRKVEYVLNHFGLDYDVKIKPLALTLPQIQTYQLPRVPIKESEKRGAAFESAFGAGAVELDALEALHPGTLARLIDYDISPYYSYEAANAINRQRRALEQAVRAQIDTITSKYSEHLAALEKMQAELGEITIDTEQFKVDRFAPDVEENSAGWLFDSQRPYVEQINHYKAHKGKAS